jgi:hypothetical protein
MEKVNNQYYRFKAFVVADEDNLASSNRHSVGMAYMRDSVDLWTLKLWTFPESRFYLLPDKNIPSRMIIFTRELKKDKDAGSGKYFWNRVGSAAAIPSKDIIRLDFDLFGRPVFLSIFPEEGRRSDVSELSEFRKVG